MMLHIKMLGELRAYLPSDSIADECKIDFKNNCTLSEVLSQFKIPESVPYIVLVNGDLLGNKKTNEIVLKAEDQILLFQAIKGG